MGGTLGLDQHHPLRLQSSFARLVLVALVAIVALVKSLAGSLRRRSGKHERQRAKRRAGVRDSLRTNRALARCILVGW